VRLLALILIVFAVVGVGFLIFGESLWFDPARPQEFFEAHRRWVIPLSFGLMLADLALPVPSSAVMYGCGWTYGALVGGLVGAAACLVSSLVAYGLCRRLGRPAALRIAGAKDLARTRAFFSRWGSLAVVAARPVPLLAEAVYCLAGLSSMPFGRFVAASAIGSLAFALPFAWLGAAGRALEAPLLMLLLSVAIPALLWLPVAIYFHRRATPGTV